MSIRVAIAGATGYTGEELIRLLLHHPHVQLTHLAASAKWDRPSSASVVFPRFASLLDIPVESLERKRLIESADVIFLALPHGSAMEIAAHILGAGKKVIDLSGDFRLRDPKMYPRWYKLEHSQPQLLNTSRVAYGLSEFNKSEIQNAQLIANPGCYATSI